MTGVTCPHCNSSYHGEEGPVCPRCGGRVSNYNTRADDILVGFDEKPHEAVRRRVDETRETKFEDWPDKEVITFE